jgi:uncharacterized membrane protein YecN with MAPEG domain
MPTITPIYAAILALFYLFLAIRISGMRMKHRISIGTGENKELAVAVRVHGNFAEYVPLALLLMAFAEMQGAGATALHAMGAVLAISRIAHAVGISRTLEPNVGRAGGSVGTFAVIIAAAVILLKNALGF